MTEQSTFQIYLKGENKTENVLDYKRIGNKYEVTFIGGKVFTYNASNVQIIESALSEKKSRDCFDYLKRLAEEIGLKAEVEEGKVINILSHNYSKINFVNPDSVLGAFLTSKLPEQKTPSSSTMISDTVYPFGFNVSQKSAVDKALANPLSIIKGPPGTGKTQTILNIIANVVMRGESVAVISSNNSATKNVFEKLQKNNVEFIAAYLGNTTNKIEFINSQKPLPDMASWKLAEEEVAKLKQTLIQKNVILQEKLIQQQELAALKLELSAVETEKKHFLRYIDVLDQGEFPIAIKKLKSSREALQMWLLCESDEFVFRNNVADFFKRFLEYLKLMNRREIFIRKLIREHSLEYLITAFQQRFYEIKFSELTESVSGITHQLESFDFQAKMKEYSEISLQIFRSRLAEKYESQEREVYEIDDLRKNSKTFIRDYPVILSTSYSLRSSLSNSVIYDYVIIDESSQVDLCTGALALSCAKKAVVVGDLKQLPHVVDLNTSKTTDAIWLGFGLSEVYRYKNQSLLSSLIKMFPDAPSTLLREHYRCHPKIIDFCNKKFYGGELVVLTEPRTDRDPLIVYKTVEGNHERNKMNQRQIDVIKEEIIPQQSLCVTDGSLGIVTPYRSQTNALQKAFAGMKVKADTVDKFQGQENSVLILSTVDNEVTEFSDNANRLNVAISRAIDQLIVVVSDADTISDTNIGDLVRYIQYNNFSIVESKIYSVFDYLYRSYTAQRCEFLAKHKRVSAYDSENLMYAKITEVLGQIEHHSFEVAIHIPLRMIICDTGLLTPVELKYAMNVMTHVDFLIFDTVSKLPKLIVEVDGVAFHREGTKQAERDVMKDEILRKFDLSILRLKTNESGEGKRLLEALDKKN